MQSKGIKSQLTILLAVLLAIGMVLINLVVTIFWQRSLIRAETEKARSALSLMADMGEKMPENNQPFSPQDWHACDRTWRPPASCSQQPAI